MYHQYIAFYILHLVFMSAREESGAPGEVSDGRKVAPVHFRRLSVSAAPSHDVSAFGLSTRVTIRVTTGASYEASEGGRTVIYQQWWW